MQCGIECGIVDGGGVAVDEDEEVSCFFGRRGAEGGAGGVDGVNVERGEAN